MRRVIDLPAPGTGAAVWEDQAYVTTAEPAGRVLAVDLVRGTVLTSWRVGHTPLAPLLSADGKTLFVLNRFDHSVTFIRTDTGAQRTVGVVREPVAQALSVDGRHLFVANLLPRVTPALDEENPSIAAAISVIDTATAKVLRQIVLPNGSQSVRGIAVSPDGLCVAAVHVISHYEVPTTRVDKGAMNMNALSLIDAHALEWKDTVLLDDPEHGAANPWAVAFDDGGRRLLITHAGTYELSVIDFPALWKHVETESRGTGLYGPKDLYTMEGLRLRLPLGVTGPRALLALGGTVYVPGYFSDTLALVDLDRPVPRVRVVALLSPPPAPSLARLGEQYFNDATACRQGWQSCATCHPDGRSDALYWDLLNDGVGNTKNTKSLLMSALTPPVMWRGKRADAAAAVLGGIRHIQFASPKPGQEEALLAYLTSMKATPSPRLRADEFEAPKQQEPSCMKCHYPGVPRGRLTEQALRGKGLFEGKAGCAACHPHPFFTTCQQVDPGLGSGVLYDVPSLAEVWRTAPHLHDGAATTLRETLTDFNVMQIRGHTASLTEQEIADLIAYVESL